ncbi:hypothetical protein pEaSNUABM46_00278 [Erwinia phage pEa_SNUABM_46]|nr:hypothetical protein pEaSNUABM45_00278 [Erwinia phage pEa_SNUABM_45]QYW04262.1 hypothetical protein pEaSNUABM46_00278 [Erwinia phage pEa_SNUABM_46]
MMRNFTAILPVTCNADCSFCPEKEMEQKATNRQWLTNLISQINDHAGEFDHVSISGGEPTLKPKFLFEVIDAIRTQTDIDKVGLTSNGRFLNKQDSIFQFLDLNTDDMLESKLSHLNISRHSFDDAKNNEIMKVRYTYTLDDLVKFRRQLGTKLSFHINFVINEHNIDNIEWEFAQANRFMMENPWIDVVFRVDYADEKLNRRLRRYGLSVQAWRDATRGSIRDERIAREKLKKKPKLVQLFDGVFSGTTQDNDGTFTDACPSCFVHRSQKIHNNHAWLKASSYEPNVDEEEYTEYVFHMDGELYYDWSRAEPVPAVEKKPRKHKAIRIIQREVEEDDMDEDMPASSRMGCQYRTVGCSYGESESAGGCSFRSPGSCSF